MVINVKYTPSKISRTDFVVEIAQSIVDGVSDDSLQLLKF